MSDTIDIADALRKLQSPWLGSIAAAEYLGYAHRTFAEKIAVKPGFPEPRWLNGTTPRWKRAELDEWAEAQPRRRQPSLSAKSPMSGA